MIRPLWDTDLFWHVAAGDLIRASDQLPSTDTFSAFHPESAWTPFQWAYEVLVSLFDQLGGLSALRWLHIGFHIFAFGLVAILAQRRLGTWGLLATAILMVGYLDRFRARPHVFNLIGALLLLIWLAREDQAQNGKQERNRGFKKAIDHDGPLMLLGLIWANLHAGGSLLLFAIGGPFTLGYLLEKSPRAWPLIRAMTLTAIFMALSPGYLDGILQAGAMVGATKELIPEWQNTLVYLSAPTHIIHPIMGLLPFLMLVLVALNLRGRQELPRLLTSLALIGLSLTTARFLYLAGLVPLVWPQTLTRMFSARGARIFALVLAFFFVHEHLWVQRATPMDHISQMDRTLERGHFPEQAMDFVAESKIDGRAMHQSDWGGLLLYFSRDGDCSLPRIRVAADGRGNLKAEVVKHLKKSHQLQGRRGYLQNSLTEFPIDLVVFPPEVFELNQYDRDMFRLVFADAQAEIYLVQGPRFQANLKAAMGYYETLAPGLLSADMHPQEQEQLIRSWWGQKNDSTTQEQLKGAQSACKTGKVSGIAQGLDAAQILEGKGLLEEAHKILSTCADLAPANHPIKGACKLRMAANRLRAGKTIQEVLPIMEGVRTEGFSPSDQALIRKIRRAISP